MVAPSTLDKDNEYLQVSDTLMKVSLANLLSFLK